MAKKIDTRDSLRVVTSNNFIVARDLSDLSLNARKLLYLAAAQCRQNDSHFYIFETTLRELAALWGIDGSNLYQEIDKISTELMKIVITVQDSEDRFQKRHLFEQCDYRSKVLRFKLHREMTELLLDVKKDFTKPLLMDFMRMRSPYSMAVWHLMQREMRSFKPLSTAPMVFELTIEEIRKATGTENKLKQIVELKNRVLDKALKEIKDQCLVSITYRNIKKGRTIVAFEFTAVPVYGLQDIENMSIKERQMLRKADLIGRKGRGEKLTAEEEEELEYLKELLSQ